MKTYSKNKTLDAFAMEEFCRDNGYKWLIHSEYIAKNKDKRPRRWAFIKSTASIGEIKNAFPNLGIKETVCQYRYAPTLKEKGFSVLVW